MPEEGRGAQAAPSTWNDRPGETNTNALLGVTAKLSWT